MYAVHQTLMVKSYMSTNLVKLSITTARVQLTVTAGSRTLGVLEIVITWLLDKQTMQEIVSLFGVI